MYDEALCLTCPRARTWARVWSGSVYSIQYGIQCIVLTHSNNELDTPDPIPILLY